MKHIVFLTGSGISKESGIPTFRDSDGLWNNFKVEDVATIEGYRRDKKTVINFYNNARKQMSTCKPNKAHELIAELEKNPEYKVTVITQNVDKLHEAAGSTNVIHLHGEIDKATSSLNPNNPSSIVTITADIKIGDTADDGSQLRPFIVWFGEDVPNLTTATNIVRDADIFVVIGTSLQVYPAALLIYDVPIGNPVYIIDPSEVKVDDTDWVMGPEKYFKRTHIQKVATEGMQELYNILNK